jgi:hypothetical protein
MTENAVSLRDARKRDTIHTLTEVARRFTIERGFAGFTVDEEQFVAARGDLLDDFVETIIRRWELLDPLSDAPALFAVIEHEPRLLKGIFERMAESERRDVALIVRREGAHATLLAEVVVHSVGALIRMAVEQILHHHSVDAFEDLVMQRLAIARAAFTSSQKAR